MTVSTLKTNFSQKKMIEPIREFLKCLTPPKNSEPVVVSEWKRGKQIFQAKCISCHSNEDGTGFSAYRYEQMGIPKQYENVMSDYEAPDMQSRKTLKIINSVKVPKYTEFGAKVRRLSGIWTRKHLTLNGSIKGLDHFFCLNGKKRIYPDASLVTTDGIHQEICDESISDRTALKEFLKHF